MIRLTVALALIALPAMAEETPLSGPQITKALADKTLTYASATQEFRASGATYYDDGQPSWGYWEVRGDQYCSTWPPQNGWVCYDVLADPDRPGEVVFIGESGTRYIGVVKR